MDGKAKQIWSERNRKLEQARQLRRERRASKVVRRPVPPAGLSANRARGGFGAGLTGAVHERVLPRDRGCRRGSVRSREYPDERHSVASPSQSIGVTSFE